jgi:hypothetical protein
MRGTVAKRLRRQVYGKGYHPGPVQYFTSSLGSGVRVADRPRWNYQKLKKEYSRGSGGTAGSVSGK